MRIGTCPMCLGKDKQLASSHLMPSALYDTCDSPDSNPIKVSSEIVMETSRQTQDYLLCAGKGGCEEALNKGGETWTLPMLMKKDRSFPLYDLLVRSTPEVDDGDVKAYAASRIPAIDVQRIAHFAMGIFWKASIHSWKKDKGKPRIKLGRYSETIRRYLLGEAGFPEGVSLMVNVVAPEKAMLLFTDPVTGEDRHSHFVYVPGIMFAIMVDRANTEEIRSMCFAKNEHHPIMVFDALTAQFENQLMQQFSMLRNLRSTWKQRKSVTLRGPQVGRQENKSGYIVRRVNLFRKPGIQSSHFPHRQNWRSHPCKTTNLV
jgi:hypothetical protein